jgi:hypothetical protein
MTVNRYSNIIESHFGNKIQFDWTDGPGADIVIMTLIEGAWSMDLGDSVTPAELGPIELVRNKAVCLLGKYARHIWHELVNADGWKSGDVLSRN